MSQRIESDAKERVRAAVDIVDLVGGYLPLRRQGRIFVALCPWHDDSRPSLQVNPDRQSWKCWVCADGGDIFNFVMKREGVDFRQALEMLAERAGIELAPRRPGAEGAVAAADDKRLLYRVMAWVEEQYHLQLLQSPVAEPARKYLVERSIDADSIRRFRLGFAPPQWRWLVDLARTAGWSDAALFALGLAARSERGGDAYDRFRGRLIFPIHDAQGRSIALGGRVVPGLSDDESAKYINSPETRLFTKSEHLYALDIARDAAARRRELIVMEGYTDVIAARQAGIDNVSAVLGTALGPRHVRLLRRYADRVVLVLDGDEAGQRRTAEILDLFVANQLDARIVTLPDGLDPADFLKQRGADDFRRLADAAIDALEFKLSLATRGIDPVSDTHRANAALEDVLGTLARSPGLGSSDPNAGAVRLREQQTLVRLARYFMVDEQELRLRLAALRQAAPAPREQREGPEAGVNDEPLELHPWECEVFSLLIERPSLVSALLERIGPADMETVAARELLAVYQALDAEGRLAEFSVVMTAVESPELKRLLVDLDDRVGQRGESDVDQRFQDVLAAYQRRRQELDCRQRMFVLEKEKLSEEEQLHMLKDIIEGQRNRQGITTPMDG